MLLEAGIAPMAAWGYLAEHDELAAAVRASSASPDEVAAAIREHAVDADDELGWRCIAAAWEVATAAGAALAPTLLRIAEVLHEQEEQSREVEVALAGPRATARVMLALPPIGLALGALLGVDVLGALLGSPPGLVCLGIGIALLVAGRRWTGRLVATARERDPTPGLALELVAIAVAGGASAASAMQRVATALEAAGLPASGDPDATLEFAARAGVPVAALLRSSAREARRAARARARQRAAELGTRLLLPLGACILPSFVALGVTPFLLAMLAGATIG